MKYLFLIVIVLFTASANGQFGKKILDKAKEKASQKANQKTNETIDKGVEKVDSVLTGKKRDKTNNTKKGTETTEPTSDNSGSSNNNTGNGAIETSYKEVIVKTNIRCEAGKKNLETILRNTDGVSSVMIDNDNGNLYLSSENPDVRNKVIELIRQNGFEADGKKPTKSLPNPCK